MDTKIPSLYQKRDRNFYFTYRGKQYYAGSTREAATQKLLEVVGTGNSDGPHSIKDAVREYLDSIEGVQSPDSVSTKRRTYKRVFADLPEIKSIYDITPEVLEALRSKMLKTLEKTSVSSTFLQLSAFLQHFVVKGVLLQNSARKLPKLKLFSDPSPDFLDEDERAKLLGFCNECRDPFIRKRDHLVFVLILNTGLRRIEVSQLKWSDIDLVKRVLVVRSGKGGKHRVIAINDTLYAELSSWPRNGEFVVLSNRKTGITRDGLSSITAKYLDKLNHHYQPELFMGGMSITRQRRVEGNDKN